jgi:hypothetical protein
MSGVSFQLARAQCARQQDSASSLGNSLCTIVNAYSYRLYSFLSGFISQNSECYGDKN